MNELPANIVSNRMAYLDSNAKPLAYGRLMIYEDNSSTALALVYGDMELANLLENPVLLDSDGRAHALYTEGSVYVKVEKYEGEDEHGNNIYSKVYDFETPPGVDISQYFNVNYVETYRQLRDISNHHPTWVTGEGNPHLYVWNPNISSNGGLNEITDISSNIDPSGSWHWETKEVYVDQAGIKKTGQEYNTDLWGILEGLGTKKIIIPPGRYYFNREMEPTTFYDLEIMGGVYFENLSDYWKISVSAKVECFSAIPWIKWVSLPRGFYDDTYFPNIDVNAFDQYGVYIKDSLNVQNNIIAQKNITAKENMTTENRMTAKELNVSEHATIGTRNTQNTLKIYGKTEAHNIDANFIQANYLNSKTIRLVDNDGLIVEAEGKNSALSLVSIKQENKFDGWVYQTEFDNSFPIGSYITATLAQKVAINTEVYLLDNQYFSINHSGNNLTANGEAIRCIITKPDDVSKIIATFLVSGIIGYGDSPFNFTYRYIYLLRRIE